MKKIYLTPSLTVVHIGLESIIAESDPTVNNERGNGFQLTKGEAEMDGDWESEGSSTSSWEEW